MKSYDMKWGGYDGAWAEMEENYKGNGDWVPYADASARIAALEAERDALRDAYWELYHAAWHVLDDSEDTGDDVMLLRQRADALCKLLPDEEQHPERAEVLGRITRKALGEGR